MIATKDLANGDGEPHGQTDAYRPSAEKSNQRYDVFDRSGFHALSNQLSARFGDQAGNAINPFSATDKEFDLKRFFAESVLDIDQESDHGQSMGVAWKDLSVSIKSTVTSVSPTLGNLLSSLSNLFRSRAGAETILQDLQGYIAPGEMLLILGRPGAGCTTLLRTLALDQEADRTVHGQITYQGLTPDEIRAHYRGEVVYCAEDDIHFPTLTVRETLTFATTSRTPQRHHRTSVLHPEDGLSSARSTLSRAEWAKLVVEVLGTVLGLRRAFDTLVGNDLIRGISGGQRKRVSIAEALAGRAKVAFFDNSSRGLDSKSTLEFGTGLRIGADMINITVAAAIYQAGEQVTRLFDNVLLLNQGRQVFFGTLDEACQHFTELGFERQPFQTSADYLVACTYPPEAALLAKKDADPTSLPISPEQQELRWRASRYYEQASSKTERHLKAMAKDAKSRRKIIKEASSTQHAKTQRKTSSYLISPLMQIRLTLLRRLQIISGDRVSLLIPIFAAIFQSLITASVYTKVSNSTAGFFSRGGVIFFSILYSCLTSMSEVGAGYAQKTIIIRHRQYAFVHPWTDAAALSLIEIVVKLVQVGVFDIIIYFMSGLAYTAEQFFLFFAGTYLSALILTSFFRFLAAALPSESQATLVAGLVVLDLVVYAGYAIPRTSMSIWWKWLSYCNPVSFAFEVLMTNEFRYLRVPCAQLVPFGPNYENVSTNNQVCPIPGVASGQTTVDGSTYVNDVYGYTYSNTTRNMVILLGFYVFFTAAYCVATEYGRTSSGSSASLLRLESKSNAVQHLHESTRQPRSGDVRSQNGQAEVQRGSLIPHGISPTQMPDPDLPLFWWRDLSYEVSTKAGPRRLLSDITGYVAPGKITALMGTSGAGKTTLLNVLADRAGVGVVTGDVKVNNAGRAKGFQRSTGYCQQQDVHLETQTVREALTFSALLRRSHKVTKAEKLAYVDEIMDLLELTPLSNVVIGEVGTSLDVEQRKRLTIGVELVAKPALLMFLDEPTSGMDSVAAASIVKLLKRVASVGQAILCTVHQPSAQLFSSFDRLLLLQAGGETVYFGDIGPEARDVLGYFESISRRRCPELVNPAEFMLDLVADGTGGHNGAPQDWHEAYKASGLPAKCIESIESYLCRPSSGEISNQDEDAEFAETRRMQNLVTIHRIFTHYWRSPTYVTSKLMLNFVAGLFVGSSFWNAGGKDDASALQNRLFSVFMALILASPLAQQIQPMFIHLRNIYNVREGPSKMYSWKTLVLSQIMVEIPWNLLGGTLFWIPWYFMVGFKGGHKVAASMWGLLQLFELFFTSLSLALASFAPNSMTASVLFSTLFSFVLLFCGVTQPKDQMPSFWSSWMFHLTPFKYFVESMVGLAAHDRPVRCAEREFNLIVPPQGQSCESYLGAFSVSVDKIANASTQSVGYFTQLANGDCAFCSKKVGDDYLASLSFSATHIYRNLGIICAYIVFNFFLYFALFYLVWIFQGLPDEFSSAVKKFNKACEVHSSRAKGPALLNRGKAVNLPVSGLIGGATGANTDVGAEANGEARRSSHDLDS